MSNTDQGNDAIAEYIREGERKARELDNRGPIKFNSDGSLDNRILDAYSRYSFYVFEDVVTDEELNDLQTELEHMLERAPYTKDALLDARGRPALGSDFTHPVFNFAKPLSDPVGGTSKNKGRHHVKMSEPNPPSDAPDYVLYTISAPLQLMDSCLRLYGHPQLLSVAEQINGPDFAPFGEAIFVKQPGLGHLSLGTRTAPHIGTIPVLTRVHTVSISCFNSTEVLPEAAYGYFPGRTREENTISKPWSRQTTVPTVFPGRFHSSVNREMLSWQTAKRCTVRSPTRRRIGGRRSTSDFTATPLC